MAEPATSSGKSTTPSGNSLMTSDGPAANKVQQIADLINGVKDDATDQAAAGAPEKDPGEPGGGGAGAGADAGSEAAAEPPAADAGPPAAEAGDAEAAGAGGDEGQSVERPEGTRTLKETADALKTSAKLLYEMEVPLNDGSGRYLSVEDLKAGYLAGEAGTLDGERHEFAREKARHEAARIEHESRVIQSTRELQQVLAMVSGAVPVEQLQRLQGLAQERHAQERRQLLEIMPQFRDGTVYQGWLTKAESLMGRYGFTEAEARNIADHRIYKMLDDYMRLSARMADLDRLAEGDPVPPRPVKRRTGKPVGRTKQAVERAKASGQRRDQVTAVAALLADGQK